MKKNNSSKDFDWKKHINACLASTDYCSLATFDGKKVWSNPVYFAYDKNYQLYFYSMPKSLHMQNIKKNPQIAVSIYATHQDTQGDVCGVQIDAKAILIADKDVKEAMKIYYDRVYPQGEHTVSKDKHIGKNAVWKFVKIIPKTIYYFDTRFFGEERVEVPLHAIR